MDRKKYTRLSHKIKRPLSTRDYPPEASASDGAGGTAGEKSRRGGQRAAKTHRRRKTHGAAEQGGRGKGRDEKTLRSSEGEAGSGGEALGKKQLSWSRPRAPSEPCGPPNTGRAAAIGRDGECWGGPHLAQNWPFVVRGGLALPIYTFCGNGGIVRSFFRICELLRSNFPVLSSRRGFCSGGGSFSFLFREFVVLSFLCRDLTVCETRMVVAFQTIFVHFLLDPAKTLIERILTSRMESL